MQEACVDQGSEKTASVIEETRQSQQTDKSHGKTAVSKLENWQVNQPAVSGGYKLSGKTKLAAEHWQKI